MSFAHFDAAECKKRQKRRFFYFCSNFRVGKEISRDPSHFVPCQPGKSRFIAPLSLSLSQLPSASKTNGWESFDFRRDFKQFSAPITLVQPVDGGIFVGTEKELALLGGTEFDKLAYTRVLDGPTVLGSGVAVPGELVRRGDGAGQGAAMVCIAGRGIVAGFSDGGIARMTEGRYATDVTEVAATFRMVNGAPQYLAVPL